MNAYELVLVLKKKNIEENIILYIIEGYGLSKKKQKYQKLEELLSTVSSMQLYVTDELYKYVFTTIFEDIETLEYILSKNEIFNKYYKKEFIEHNKTFKLMTKKQSFLHSILFEMYH